MKRFYGFLLTCAFVGALPSSSAAQCSNLKTVVVLNFSHLCHGGNPNENFLDGKDWSVWAETACADNGWKKFDNPQADWDTRARSYCGTTPANTPPICPGTLEGPYDLGYHDETHTHNVRM